MFSFFDTPYGKKTPHYLYMTVYVQLGFVSLWRIENKVHVNLASFTTIRINSGFVLYTENFHVVHFLLHRGSRIPFKETLCSN
jgi:hypothetical protein